MFTLQPPNLLDQPAHLTNTRIPPPHHSSGSVIQTSPVWVRTNQKAPKSTKQISKNKKKTQQKSTPLAPTGIPTDNVSILPQPRGKQFNSTPIPILQTLSSQPSASASKPHPLQDFGAWHPAAGITQRQQKTKTHHRQLALAGPKLNKSTPKPTTKQKKYYPEGNP